MEKTTSKRNTVLNIIAIAVPLAVLAVTLIWGYFFAKPGDEILYAITCFYILMPLAALISSCLLTISCYKFRWLVPVDAAIFGLLMPLIAVRQFEPIFMLFTVVPSLFGVAVTVLIKFLTEKNKAK